jgi:putative ABC transport system substrate-binding protein
MITRYPFIGKPDKAFPVLLAALAVLACPLHASSAACETAVVVSADLKPYREVLQGIRDASVCTVREVALRDGDVLERVRRTSPNAVVAIGTEAFRTVRSFRDAPVVHVMVIPSVVERSPSEKLSGVSMSIDPGAWLSAIKRVFPGAKRIGLLFDPRNTGPFVAEAVAAAPAAGFTLRTAELGGADEVPNALNSLRDSVDVLWMLPDPAVASAPVVEYLVRFSIQHRIPIMTFSGKYLELGAVASLDVDPHDMGVQAAEIAVRLARGGDGPVRVYARKTKLSVNRNAAGKMGVLLGASASWGGIADE